MVSDGKAIWGDEEVTVDRLSQHRVYKTLSILAAGSAGIPTPPFLLLLGEDPEALTYFAKQWAMPLMIRIDYRRLPRSKPIGGISIDKMETMMRVCRSLLAEDCYPLLHPNIDRMSDVYSCGAIMSAASLDAELEFVGRGFDAGDLRRGTAIPHERMRFNLSTGSISEHSVIAPDEYEREKHRRARYATALDRYTSEVNKSGHLKSAINVASSGAYKSGALERIPTNYERVPKLALKSLLPLIDGIRLRVLSTLPPSAAYVASFSFLPNKTWVLWDIYGHWYRS
jgi:hypothetical protein